MSDNPGDWFDWFGGEGGGGGGSGSDGGESGSWGGEGIGDALGGAIGAILGPVVAVGLVVGGIYVVGAALFGTGRSVVAGGAPAMQSSSPVGTEILDVIEEIPALVGGAGNSGGSSDGARSPQQPSEWPAYRRPDCWTLINDARRRWGRNWEGAMAPEDASRCRHQMREARRAFQPQPAPQVERAPRFYDQNRRAGPPREIDNQQRQATVFVDGLNLTNPAEAAEMLRRVKQGAIQACGGRPDARDIGQRRLFRRCFEAAVDRGVADLHAPVVWALRQAER